MFGHMPMVSDSLRASVRVSAEVRDWAAVRALLGLGLRYEDIYT